MNGAILKWLLSVLAKPIDLLAQYISTEADEDLDIKMHEPYMLLVVS